MLKTGIIKQCFREMEKSPNSRYKMGAVIFKGSRILSSGFNEFRASKILPQHKRFIHTLHAEQAALVNARTNWTNFKNCSILVMRTNMSGNLSLAYPCKYCKSSLQHIGIKWVYFSDRKGQIVKEKLC